MKKIILDKNLCSKNDFSFCVGTEVQWDIWMFWCLRWRKLWWVNRSNMKKWILGYWQRWDCLFNLIITNVSTERPTYFIVYVFKITSLRRVILVRRNSADILHDQPLNILTGTLFLTLILMMTPSRLFKQRQVFTVYQKCYWSSINKKYVHDFIQSKNFDSTVSYISSSKS